MERKHNGQKKKDKRTNNNLQTIFGSSRLSLLDSNFEIIL
jgi:hypothetical protein